MLTDAITNGATQGGVLRSLDGVRALAHPSGVPVHVMYHRTYPPPLSLSGLPAQGAALVQVRDVQGPLGFLCDEILAATEPSHSLPLAYVITPRSAEFSVPPHLHKDLSASMEHCVWPHLSFENLPRAVALSDVAQAMSLCVWRVERLQRRRKGQQQRS